MASYEIGWKQSAKRELRKLPEQARRRILDAVEKLANNPRPSGARKLRGSERAWRLRIGDYRVVYSVQKTRLVVIVLRVANRKDVYRR